MNLIKFIYWLPRIVCIVAIGFISLFALDSFDSNHTIWRQILDFIMHLVPSYVLIAILITAWKWERIGGWLFIVTGTLLSPIVFRHNYQMNHSVGMSLFIISMITVPFIFVGILFLLSSRLNVRKPVE